MLNEWAFVRHFHDVSIDPAFSRTARCREVVSRVFCNFRLALRLGADSVRRQMSVSGWNRFPCRLNDLHGCPVEAMAETIDPNLAAFTGFGVIAKRAPPAAHSCRSGGCRCPHRFGDDLEKPPSDDSSQTFADAPVRIVVTDREGSFRISAATREKWSRFRWSREVQARLRDRGPVPAKLPTPDPCCPSPDFG